jgi:hypothetical protein
MPRSVIGDRFGSRELPMMRPPVAITRPLKTTLAASICCASVGGGPAGGEQARTEDVWRKEVMAIRMTIK